MNWTKFSIGTLIGGLAYFFLGWLVYGIFLKDAMTLPGDFQQTVVYPEEEFKISLMFLSCLAFGALLSLILLRWANISTFMGGLKAGAIIGALISLMVGLSLAAQYRIFSINSTLIDTVASIVTTGLSAGLIGWYLGRNK